VGQHPRHGFFRGQQFLVEGKVPVVQSLDGPPITEELAAFDSAGNMIIFEQKVPRLPMNGATEELC
jgi:hypothetical protein